MSEDKVLITGAAGYIGSRLAERLAKNLTVVGVDIREPATPQANFEVCDIRDKRLADIVSQHQITHVVHLASVLESSGDEARDYDIDVNGTRNVVEACLSSGVRHLTVTSSGAAYGYHADNPTWIDEDDPLRGNEEFAYSKHKKLVENYLAEVRKSHPELQQLILRPGTVLGRETRNQITNLFDKNRILAISGSDSPFVFIWDEDVLDIIEMGIRESKVGRYNLAGDGAMSIFEIARRLNKPVLSLPAGLLKLALSIAKPLRLSRYSPQQINFLRYRPVLSNRRLKSEFGYTPQLTSREVFELFVENRQKNEGSSP
ncbi:UDP-glucose 4-epimerase [Litorivivens lipolytica]|uniref:UDP-glucose 4-epimerase n=1 Tax=Litorivivens lipolytica TaxID=1524264 RepID=A0A7W4W527_9GAMM|nr:SDR family oxidoreductase [Litorivivens lipolytica]MBB3047590.1 UDP-glucose 4-epimerase [Litorivivens lipolytica]